MTTTDAADRLGIKPRSVVALIRRGLLTAEKRGRDWWIEPEEAERYASERRAQHRPRAAYAEAPKDRGGRPRKERKG